MDICEQNRESVNGKTRMVTMRNKNYERYTYQETCEVYLADIKHKDMIPNGLLFSMIFDL